MSNAQGAGKPPQKGRLHVFSRFLALVVLSFHHWGNRPRTLYLVVLVASNLLYLMTWCVFKWRRWYVLSDLIADVLLSLGERRSPRFAAIQQRFQSIYSPSRRGFDFGFKWQPGDFLANALMRVMQLYSNRVIYF